MMPHFFFQKNTLNSTFDLKYTKVTFKNLTRLHLVVDTTADIKHNIFESYNIIENVFCECLDYGKQIFGIFIK